MSTTKVLPFEVHTRQTISRLRTAFGAILSALPKPMQRPHEVQKQLGVDAKLGWEIANFMQQEDLLLSVKYLPSPRRAERFLQAAESQGVATQLIDQARSAIRAFDELISIHAGDRASFEMMLLGCSSEVDRDAVLAHRKAAFQANSFIWGAQAQTQFGIYIMRPGDDPSWGDIAAVRGFIGLRRLRPNVPWVISRLRATDEQGQDLSGIERYPIDPGSGGFNGGVADSLMREFCSKPLPEIRRVTHSAGFVEEVLVESDVGSTAAIDCVTGDDARRVVPRHQMEGETVWGGLRMLRTPVRWLVLDQLVHEDLFGPIEPRLILFSDLSLCRGFPAPAPSESDRLETTETVQYLGKDLTVVYTPEIPRYAELIEYTCAKIGCDVRKLDIYRVKIEYPVIPTSIGMEHDLPEQPYGGT